MQHSIVFKSLLNEEFRIDSEYYTPDNLVRDEAVKKYQYKLLGDICTITAGPFGSTVTTDRYDPESVAGISGERIYNHSLLKRTIVYLLTDIYFTTYLNFM
jgi:hypothetical protein